MEQNVKILIENLISKTEKKEAIWNKSNLNEQFILRLENGSVTLRKRAVVATISYRLNILNENGDIIISLNERKKEPPALSDDYDILKELFDKVKRVVYKTDETIESLLKETNKKGSLGKSDTDFLIGSVDL